MIKTRKLAGLLIVSVILLIKLNGELFDLAMISVLKNLTAEHAEYAEISLNFLSQRSPTGA